MPNWCFGSLIITCSEEQRETNRTYVHGDEKVLDLNRIIPIDSDDNVPLHEVWGSCSNVDEVCANNTGYTFVTAWTPCSHAVEALAKQFPEASFRYVYDESSMGFCGAEVYENGQLVYSLDADYHETFDDDEEDPEGEPSSAQTFCLLAAMSLTSSSFQPVKMVTGQSVKFTTVSKWMNSGEDNSGEKPGSKVNNQFTGFKEGRHSSSFFCREKTTREDAAPPLLIKERAKKEKNNI